MAFDPKLFEGPVYSQPQIPTILQNQPQEQQPQMSGWQSFWNKIKSYVLKPTGEFLAGSPGGYEQVGLYEPHQRNALNFVLSDALGQLQNPYQGYEPIQNEAIRNFQERTIPALSETFQGGRLSSPLFQKQLGYAGSGLESNLAAQKAQYGMDARNQALSQLQIGLTPQLSTQYFGSTPGLFQGSAEAAGKAGAGFLGGKFGF